MKIQALALAFLAATAVGGLAWVFVYPLLSGEKKAEHRRASIARPEPAARQVDKNQRSRREQVEGSLKDLETRRQKENRISLSTRLTQAGLDWSTQKFMVVSGVLAAVGFAMAMLLGGGLLAAIGLAFAAGFGLPRWSLSYLKKRREKSFLKALPDAVDVIVRGIKAGLPLFESIKVVAADAPEPLRSEFLAIIETQAIGMPLGDACARLFDRMPVPEANFFGIVIAIQQKSGGNLSEALGNLSKVLRDRKKMAEKIQAMSMEAKASAGIIGALPPIVMLLVYLTTPDYISLLWTHPTGQLMLVGCGVWMSMGMLLAAIAVSATAYTLIMPLFAGEGLAKRMKAVASERERIRARERERLNKSEKVSLRQTPKQLVSKVVEDFNLGKWLAQEAARDKLTQAGYRGQAPYITFLFFRAVTPILFFVSAVLYVFVISHLEKSFPVKVGMCIAAAYLGLQAPMLFLKNAISKRQLSIRRAFPDSLDLLLICIESGMSIEAAFRKVSVEIVTQSVALSEEFTLTTAELSYLQDRKVAYENLAKRTGLDGVKSVCLALQQSERYGTPLGQSLRVMAQENRDMRMNEAEKKAAALPPKLTVPMILFFLPVLFVVILGPTGIKVAAMQ